MNDRHHEMKALIGQFVEQLTTVARRAAIETLRREITDGRDAPSAVGRSRPTRAHRAPGAKRSQEEIDQLATRVLAVVEVHPGLRVEEINKTLGASPGDVALPIVKLLAQRLLKTEGQRRGTKYFPAGSVRPRSKRRAANRSRR
jgi:hypothetical protein